MLDVAKDLLSGNLEYVQNHIKEERAGVCRSCEHIQNLPGAKIGRCGKCGCFMDAKTALSKATCPINKWVK